MNFFIKIYDRSFIRKTFLLFQKRNFLSNEFECNDVWNNRLNAQLFQKINIESMYYELNNYYNKTKKLNAVDVDIFVNAQKDDSYLTEVEELVHKLRLTADTGNTLPTTHHAFIRLFLQYNKEEDLIRILNDRLNYGIFPDNYCNIYMLNKLLKTNSIRNAAKIASIQMLQEDFSNSLVKYLSLYAIHQYLLSNEPWNVTSEIKKEEEEEEDEIKIKVPYLRNPFFDEHFDLTDGQHLCGKTLIMISSSLPIPINISYKIMGLSLFNKWDKLEYELLELTRYNEKLEKILHTLKKITPQFCIQESLLERVKIILLEEIKNHKENEIRIQEKLYDDWQILREEKLKQYLNELNIKQRLENVKRRKEELKLKEELLYFFDNESEIDLSIETKTEKIKKRTFNKSKTEEENIYVPPEIQKRILND
ncbi:hypothetical protein PGB90_001713 [Kerria lacca]